MKLSLLNHKKGGVICYLLFFLSSLMALFCDFSPMHQLKVLKDLVN